jgi:HAD superfamily hydrolase (TIGR01458 family)
MSIQWKLLKGLLFDMDGVWFVGDKPIPQAIDALQHVRERNIPCRFITNTTAQSLAQLEEKMQRLGLPAAADEIINAPRAAVLYLRSFGSPSVHCLVHENVRAGFDEFPESARPDFVVIGEIGARWNYTIMNDAFRMLINGAQLLAMHRGRYWQVDDGLTLDIGAFIAGLEYASGKQATIVGKPAPTVFASALNDMKLQPEDVVMIGDDVDVDIGGAQSAGIRGVLVKTGKYREDLVSQSAVAADAVIESVAALRDLI